jgi:hypothetical protein
MTTSTSVTNIESLFIDRVAPGYIESLVSLKFESEIEFQAWFKNVASRHGHWITRNRNVNKTNAKTVACFSEEALKACILPKETLSLVCDHAGSKSQKITLAVASDSAGMPSSDVNATVKKRRVQKKSIN